MEITGCLFALFLVIGFFGILTIKYLERIYYTLEKIERNQEKEMKNK